MSQCLHLSYGVTRMLPEHKRRIEFIFKNPPRGKFRRKVHISEVRTVLNGYETMKFLGVSKMQLHRLRKNEKIPFKKVGGRFFYKVIDLDKWMVKTGRRGPYSPTGELWLQG